MAICKLCGENKRYAASCIRVINAQVAFGDECRPDLNLGRGEVRCPDCGVSPGGYHHLDCEFEECPECRRQLVSCSCESDREPKIIAIHPDL
jgi:hypothetical protein